MRRAIAILALVSLLAGPISAWPSAGCCGDADCCKSGICPMHPKHAKAQESDEPMHCHHADAAPGPASKCSASAQCTGRARDVLLAPFMRGILSAAQFVPMPAGTRSQLAVVPASVARGFSPSPFEPPRLLA